MIKIIWPFLFVGIMCYILYIKGFLVVGTRVAVMFRGYFKMNKASFCFCTANMKRVLRFKEDKLIQLSLDCEITKGTFEVKIVDASKQTILSMDENKRTAVFRAKKKEKYYLIFNFKSASGKYELKWE